MKRSPLHRGTAELRRTRIARVGRVAKSRRRARAAVVVAVHERDVCCQFIGHVIGDGSVFLQAFLAHELTCSADLEVHEIIPRSAWPAAELEVSNAVLLCGRHHRWVGDHPRLAHEVGLHGYSYERPVA